MDATPQRVARSPLVRALWVVAGLVCVGIGALGVVLPGLPTTIFFIGAAACFTRSSPRLEAWVLRLPGIGPAVRDHRAGLGMPWRAKVLASASIVVFSGFAVIVIETRILQVAVAVAALVGLSVVLLRVPTRERVEGGLTEPA